MHPAWALLARIYSNNPFVDLGLWSRPVEESRKILQDRLGKAERAAREAIRLDSRQATAYVVLGTLEANGHNWAAAEDLYRQAVAIDPNDTEALGQYASFLNSTGHRKEALALEGAGQCS
jgi:Tfp pilus assembly protein PilF